MVFQEESLLRGGDALHGKEPQAKTAPADEWERIEADPQFRELVAAKRSFIVPATIFFVVYYFSLLVLVGYFPGLMDTKVIGQINIAYLFALSQFFMAWIVAALYMGRAGVWDKLAAAGVSTLGGALRIGRG